MPTGELYSAYTGAVLIRRKYALFFRLLQQSGVSLEISLRSSGVSRVTCTAAAQVVSCDKPPLVVDKHGEKSLLSPLPVRRHAGSCDTSRASAANVQTYINA